MNKGVTLRRAAALSACIGIAGAGTAVAAHSVARSRAARAVPRPSLLPPGTRLLAVAAQPNGAVVAAGEAGLPSHAQVLLARFTAAGAPDRSFGTRGLAHGPSLPRNAGSVARAIGIDRKGRIVVVGSTTDATGQHSHGLLAERFDARGRLDRGFGSRGIVSVLTGQLAGQGNALALEPDGGVIAGGSATASGSGGFAPRAAVVRLTSRGRPVGSFAGHGIDVLDLGAYSTVQALALDRGKIVLAGSQAPDVQVTQALLARLNSSGTVDHSFAGGLFTHQYALGAAFSSFNALVVQAGGRVLAAGTAAAQRGRTSAGLILARFTTSGRPDGSWGNGGATFTQSAVGTAPDLLPGAYGLVACPGGRIIAGGTSSSLGQTFLSLWGYSARGRVDSAFGSGGRTVLRLSKGSSTEGAGVALARGGNLVAAGDEPLLLSRAGYRGLLGRFSCPRR